jgi:hypothetical protein
MANVYAVKSGNWSDTTVWNTGALPTTADDVYSNTFTVAADTTATVLSLRNSSAAGITAGGYFTAVGGVTLTGNFIHTSPTLFISSLTTGQSFTIVGNINTGTAIGQAACINNSSGTINVIGNVLANGNGTAGIRNSSTGTVNIVGSVTGGNDVNGYGASNLSAGTINITGNVIAGGGTPSSPNYGANNASTGTLNITGNANASAQCPAVNNASTGTLTIIGAITALTYPGLASGGISQNTFLTGPFIGTAQGVVANLALRWRWIASVGSSYMTVPNSTATGYKNLYTSDSTLSQSGQPDITNVRSGTIYGPNSELTGTCAVPPAGSVALGVPVDATTGTAILTQQNVQDALSAASAVTLNQQTSSLTTSGSIGERLKLASTVATTAQQLSDALSNE